MTNVPDPIWTPAFYTDNDGIEWDYSEGHKAIEVANYSFATLPTPIKLDKFQEFIIREALARHPETGERRFRQYVVSLGRQNGKSVLAVALSLWFMLSREDPNVFCLASNREQAGIVYSRLNLAIQNNPSLSKRFLKTTETRGLQTLSGGYFRSAPSKGAALQGHSLTGVICDELHIMEESVWDAVVIGAGQQKDSLVFGITTAGSEESTLLKRLYEQGLVGTRGFGFALWEADEGASVGDIEQLKKANPALAEGRMDPETALQEVSMLPVSDAMRYRLNRFIATENAWLPMNAWEVLPRLTDDDIPNNPILVVDRTPDWAAATVAIAWKKDDLIYTDIVASIVKPDIKKLTELISTVASQNSFIAIYLDGLSLGELCDSLNLRGIKSEKLFKRDIINAGPTAYQKIVEGKVVHGHHQMVAQQLSRTITKSIGEAYKLTRPNATVEIDASLASIYSLYIAENMNEIPIQVL